MRFVLMGGKVSMSECIEINNIGEKESIVFGLIRLAQYLMTDTEATQPEIKEFSFEELFFCRIFS